MKCFIFNGIKSSFVWIWFNTAFSFLNFFFANTLYIAADLNFAVKILSMVVLFGIFIGLCYCLRIFYKFGKGNLYKFNKTILNLFSIVFVHIFILLFCGWLISYTDMMIIILNWFLYPIDFFILMPFGIYWDLSDSFFLSALLSFVPYVFIFFGLQKSTVQLNKEKKTGDSSLSSDDSNN